jgi:hypothetical protein
MSPCAACQVYASHAMGLWRIGKVPERSTSLEAARMLGKRPWPSIPVEPVLMFSTLPAPGVLPLVLLMLQLSTRRVCQ